MSARAEMVIGLKRHAVVVVEHRSEWAELFAAETRALRLAAGELAEDIQHVGSTAVPGLPAKPIIDIAIAIRSRDVIPELAERLVARGYLDRGDGGSDGGWLLVKESQTNVRTFHVHMVETDDPQWRNYLAFRDALRSDAALRDRYAALKRGLAAQFAGDRKSYTNAKHDFIRESLRRLKEGGTNHADTGGHSHWPQTAYHGHNSEDGGSMKPNCIRPIAICLFRNGGRILVSDGIDPETGSPYCRPLGGAIEFGERARDAVVREIREELGVEIREVRLLGVLENLFTLDGQQGHEIVFVYDARFVDESLYARATLPFHEAGWASSDARWLDLTQERDRLVPEGLAALL